MNAADKSDDRVYYLELLDQECEAGISHLVYPEMRDLKNMRVRLLADTLDQSQIYVINCIYSVLVFVGNQVSAPDLVELTGSMDVDTSNFLKLDGNGKIYQ